MATVVFRLSKHTALSVTQIVQLRLEPIWIHMAEPGYDPVKMGFWENFSPERVVQLWHSCSGQWWES